MLAPLVSPIIAYAEGTVRDGARRTRFRRRSRRNIFRFRRGLPSGGGPCTCRGARGPINGAWTRATFASVQSKLHRPERPSASGQSKLHRSKRRSASVQSPAHGREPLLPRSNQNCIDPSVARPRLNHRRVDASHVCLGPITGAWTRATFASVQSPAHGASVALCFNRLRAE